MYYTNNQRGRQLSFVRQNIPDAYFMKDSHGRYMYSYECRICHKKTKRRLYKPIRCLDVGAVCGRCFGQFSKQYISYQLDVYQ